MLCTIIRQQTKYSGAPAGSGPGPQHRVAEIVVKPVHQYHYLCIIIITIIIIIRSSSSSSIVVITIITIIIIIIIIITGSGPRLQHRVAPVGGHGMAGGLGYVYQSINQSI